MRALIECLLGRDALQLSGGYCPFCGNRWVYRWGPGARIPSCADADCACGGQLRLIAAGLEPPPPTPEVSRLERSWEKAAALPHYQALQPCPIGAPRQRFAAWQAQGRIPADLQPCTLGRGFRLAFGGLEPRRDRRKPQIKAYTARELEASLQALARAAELGK